MRKYLPSDFRELLEKSNVEALKEVYTKCEINAITGKYGSNAFSFSPLPRKFALWLKEQGGDVNQLDVYGNSPIFHHASVYGGNVELLLELGANGNAIGNNGMTPLHNAAQYGRADAVKALLNYGVDVNARSYNKVAFTPIEIALAEDHIRQNTCYIICKMLIDAGAEITESAKDLLAKMGKRFEQAKARAEKGSEAINYIASQDSGMQSLYQLFSVAPAQPVFLNIHDGLSKIEVKEKDINKAFKSLWEYLVPQSGIAKTAQGEAVRIVGKVSREILHNGGINWDSDYKNMLNVLPKYFQMGMALTMEDINRIKEIIEMIYDGTCNEICDELTYFCVKWVAQNPEVLPLIPPAYKR